MRCAGTEAEGTCACVTGMGGKEGGPEGAGAGGEEGLGGAEEGDCIGDWRGFEGPTVL